MNLPLCSRASALLLFLRTFVCGVGAAFILAGMARANYLDDIGLIALRAELGAAIPTGTGVGVTQVEANTSAGLSYMPDITNSDFAGKTIVARSGASAISGHATTVGVFYYGLTGSLCPGVTSVDVYNADLWVYSGFLKTNTTTAPVVESRKVQNHSWIGNVDSGGPIDLEILRRFDFAIQRDDFLAVVGVNNGSGSGIPALLANAYNAISVGLTNGDHSTGVTTVDGAGRVKPEMVAPQLATSFATPQVSSAATMLRGAAPAAGQHSVTLKSLLLAGATKDQFANWSRTSTRPLDTHYGAGQLNVFHSYHMLAAGQQTASGSTSVNKRGWDYNTTLATPRQYFFDISAGDGSTRFSAALTWNRIITDTIAGGPWGNPASTVPDLALRLYQASGFAKGALVDESISSVDNVEHLFGATLPAGRYALEVTANQTGIAYGLAWNSVSSISIAATTPEASESGLVAGVFTVTRSGSLGSALTVPYSVRGNAGAGIDYAGLAGSVTIPANQVSAIITVTPLADSLTEGDETVTVTLASGLAATFASANATVTVHDQPIEAWRFGHFTVPELGNPAISGDLADGDGDGIPNLVEYALNLNPKAVDVNALPTAYVNAGGFPTLSYNTAANATDIDYIVEISTDLVTWNAGPAYLGAAQLADGGATTATIVSSPNTITAQPRQYLRLRMTRR